MTMSKVDNQSSDQNHSIDESTTIVLVKTTIFEVDEKTTTEIVVDNTEITTFATETIAVSTTMNEYETESIVDNNEMSSIPNDLLKHTVRVRTIVFHFEVVYKFNFFKATGAAAANLSWRQLLKAKLKEIFAKICRYLPKLKMLVGK